MTDAEGEAPVEDALLRELRALATSPAARGLADDAAVLPWPAGLALVATHDMLAEGVHFTPRCPPASVGWKMVAVNYSDLAATGARPVAILFGAGLGQGRDSGWAAGIVEGVRQALDRFGGALIGGDTVRLSEASVLGLTALGSVPRGKALGRMGARAGDDLWVSGTIGGAGLALRRLTRDGEEGVSAALMRCYRRPVPRMALGLALRDVANACMDVSDGLLLDASRLAAASGLAVRIDASAIPLHPDVAAADVSPPEAASWGDDYELLFAAPPSAAPAIAALEQRLRVPITRIGKCEAGEGLAVDGAAGAALPDRLGYKHA